MLFHQFRGQFRGRADPAIAQQRLGQHAAQLHVPGLQVEGALQQDHGGAGYVVVQGQPREPVPQSRVRGGELNGPFGMGPGECRLPIPEQGLGQVQVDCRVFGTGRQQRRQQRDEVGGPAEAMVGPRRAVEVVLARRVESYGMGQLRQRGSFLSKVDQDPGEIDP